MGKIPPSIHGYCLCPLLHPLIVVDVYRSSALFQTEILSENNEWASRRDHGECVLDIGLVGRGCLGGDRLGLLFFAQMK